MNIEGRGVYKVTMYADCPSLLFKFSLRITKQPILLNRLIFWRLQLLSVIIKNKVPFLQSVVVYLCDE